MSATRSRLTLWALFGGTLVLAATACTTVTVQPGAEGQATANGAPAGHAPVVGASVRSDGTPVAPQPVGPSITPAAPPAPAPVPTPAPAVPAAGPHLQAGTFSSQTSAENVAASIRSRAPAYAARVQVQPRGSNWRVLIGPFANEAERAQAASTIRTAIGSDVVNAAP